MAYQIELLPAAARTLRKLPREAQRRIAPLIEALAKDPRPAGATALQGEPAGVLRVRVGDYRILYQVDDQDRRVLVVTLGHRREVYRRRR